MVGKISLVVDSTSDLPSPLAHEYGIHTIPQLVQWDGHVYRDGLDLTPKAFYQRLADSASLPISAPPSPEDFAAAFEGARAADGAEQVITLILSSKLSDSFHNAQAGARLVKFPVFIHDSQTVSMGLGFAALAAAQARNAGANLEQILEAARQTRRQCQQFFTVSTLDYLYRGGRIGGAQRLIGTALALKPILTIHDGQVDAAETVRTRARAVARMLDLAVEYGQVGKAQVAVLSGDADDEALELLNPIRKRLNPQLLVESHISPAIGSNTGPGVLGITVCRC